MNGWWPLGNDRLFREVCAGRCPGRFSGQCKRGETMQLFGIRIHRMNQFRATWRLAENRRDETGMGSQIETGGGGGEMVGGWLRNRR